MLRLEDFDFDEAAFPPLFPPQYKSEFSSSKLRTDRPRSILMFAFTFTGTKLLRTNSIHADRIATWMPLPASSLIVTGLSCSKIAHKGGNTKLV